MVEYPMNNDIIVLEDSDMNTNKIKNLCIELRKFKHFRGILFDSSIVLECLEETLKDYELVFGYCSYKKEIRFCFPDMKNK